MSYDSPRMEAAMKALREDLDHKFHDAPRRAATLALAAADAVMFGDENEAWVAQIVASYGVETPFACAAEIIAALKGDEG